MNITWIALIVFFLALVLGLIFIIAIKTRSDAMDERGVKETRDGVSVSRGSRMGSGIAIGMGVGVALGVAMDNIAIGIAIGMAIGVGIGSALEQRNRGGFQPTVQDPRQVWAIIIGLIVLLLGGVFFFLLASGR